MQPNPPGRQPIRPRPGTRGPLPCRPSPAPSNGGTGMDSGQRNALLSELTGMAASGSANQELLQHAMTRGLDRETGIALAKRAKQQASQQAQGALGYQNDAPPGMGGGDPAFAPQPYQAHNGAPASHANDGYTQGHAPANHYQHSAPPVQVGSMDTKALGGIGLGILLLGGGGIATMVSYNAAANGGTYTIWYGPMIFGTIILVGGIGKLLKK